jgi:8-oxo-dGTP pyrophosphatase MutT (NUDIX family)
VRQEAAIMSRTQNSFPLDDGRRYFKAVVSTAVVEDSHVLMVHQAYGGDRGRWNLPGGKVQADELLLDAAVREAREETGCEVRVRGLGGLYHFVSRSGKPTLRFLFFADTLEGYPHPCDREVMDVRWFHLDQVETMTDNQLCKPQVLRRMLADVRLGRVCPLDTLREFDRSVLQS